MLQCHKFICKHKHTSDLDLSVLRFGRTKTSLKSSLMSESNRGMAACDQCKSDCCKPAALSITGKGREYRHVHGLGAHYLEYSTLTGDGRKLRICTVSV